MPKSNAYWKKRFEAIEAASNSYGQQTFKQIEPTFDSALRQIEGQIHAWYGRFADNNNITMQEARKLLNSKELKEFKWDVQEYIKYGHENSMNQLWMKELENASAKFHISRLEALKVRTQQAAEVAFGNELDAVDKMARKVFTEDYYHSIFEMQKGFNIGWEIGQVDEKKMSKLISKPWAADGKHFSDRIWNSRTQLVSELHSQLTRACILGKAPDDAIKAISKKFHTSKSQAGRLVMTEQAYFHSVAQQEAFKELEVEEFEIVATLDKDTSEICQEMDGKHFPMKDYEAGVTAPPFHPWCRSVTVPWFEDNFTGERVARDEEGKTYYVPDDMKYSDWKQLMVDGDKSKVKENLSDEQIDAKIKDLQKKQTDLSLWGTYDEIVKDFGSIDDYFDDEDFADKQKFISYQNEIEELLKQRSVPQTKINGKNQGTALSMNDAVKANPNYKQDASYQVNCQRCVQTYEFRRRGFDVEALSKPSKSNTIIWGNECFVDSNGNTPQFIFNQTEKSVKDELAKAPDGSRYIIYVAWKQRNAHVFIAEKINGVVHYVDPQVGDLDVSHYFGLGKRGSFGYLRVDDKQLTSDMNIINATMK